MRRSPMDPRTKDLALRLPFQSLQPRRSMVALGMVTMLTMTLGIVAPSESGAAASADEVAREKRRPKTQKMASVPVTPVTYEPPLMPSRAEVPAKVTWPVAGVADVAIRPTGSGTKAKATDKAVTVG